jgi:hypothetical protein
MDASDLISSPLRKTQTARRQICIHSRLFGITWTSDSHSSAQEMSPFMVNYSIGCPSRVTKLYHRILRVESAQDFHLRHILSIILQSTCVSHRLLLSGRNVCAFGTCLSHVICSTCCFRLAPVCNNRQLATLNRASYEAAIMYLIEASVLMRCLHGVHEKHARSAVHVCPSVSLNSGTAGRIWIKFGTDFKPLGSTVESYFSILTISNTNMAEERMYEVTQRHDDGESKHLCNVGKLL